MMKERGTYLVADIYDAEWIRQGAKTGYPEDFATKQPEGDEIQRQAFTKAVQAGVPIVEIACVKDYPGAWAEYRVYEGGYTQVTRRVASPDAMAWTEKTRAMFAGLYRDYALGHLRDRCFTEIF